MKISKDSKLDSLNVRNNESMPITTLVSLNNLPIFSAATIGKFAFDEVTFQPFYGDGTVWRPFGSQTIWQYNYTAVAGAVYAPGALLPLWDTQSIGGEGMNMAGTTWTCPQDGRYEFNATVATNDLVNPNTCSLVTEVPGDPPIVRASDIVPAGISTMRVANVIDLLEGTLVYITAATDGVTTAGTGVAPFANGSGSILIISRVG